MYKIIKTETGFSVIPDAKGEYETMESAIEVGKLDIPNVRQKEFIKSKLEALSDKVGSQGHKAMQTYINSLLDKEDKGQVTVKDIDDIPYPKDKPRLVARIKELWASQLKELVK